MIRTIALDSLRSWKRDELLGVTADDGAAADRRDATTDAAVEVRRTERSLVGGRDAIECHTAHAEAVDRLTAAIRRSRKPVKQTFKSLGLDYAIARHATWIRDTVAEFGHDYPSVRSMGPSLVLVVREAARRFGREGRADGLRALVDDIEAGVPRSTLRERYLPRKHETRTGVDRVLAFMRGGRVESARREYASCSHEDRAALGVLATGLALLSRGVPDGDVHIARVVTAGSIAEALSIAAEGATADDSEA